MVDVVEGGGGRAVAVNQVSLFFYPPRWRQRLTTPDPTAFTDLGAPLQIAGVEPAADAEAAAVPISSVQVWLTECGFTPLEWGRGLTFQRGRVRSIFGPEKEIEVCLGVEGEEVADLYIRFTLPPRTPPPLPEWTGFVAEMCARFGLRLGAEGVSPCDATEFVAAVRGPRERRSSNSGPRY